jgi:hypothetical protein
MARQRTTAASAERPRELAISEARRPGRWEYAQEVCWQPPAGAPIFEADEATVGWVELAESEVRFLGDDGRPVVALKAQPSNIGLLVVVAVEFYCVKSLAPPPKRNHACRQIVSIGRVAVGDARQLPTRTRSSVLPVKRRTSSAGSLAATRSIELSTRSRIGGSRARRSRRARGVNVTPQFSSLTPTGDRTRP